MSDFGTTARTVLCALARQRPALPRSLVRWLLLYVRAAMQARGAAPAVPRPLAFVSVPLARSTEPARTAPAVRSAEPKVHAVAEFYNRRGAQARRQTQRRSSSIAQLREFNNWIKAILIGDVCRQPGARVLDVASGCGGDLHKFVSAYVAALFTVDVAGDAVREAVRRYNAMSERTMRLTPIIADAGAVRLCERMVDWPVGQCHAVTCQFALHYFFDCEARALGVLQNIADALAPQARAVVSFPCAGRLLKLLSARPPGELEVRNSICSIAFAERVPFVVDAGNSVVCPEPRLEFGCAYRFRLADLVDAEEYIIWPNTLLRLAARVGLIFDSTELFDETARRAAAAEAFTRLPAYARSHDASGRVRLSADECTVAALYRSVVFVRAGVRAQLPPAPHSFWPRLDDTALVQL